MENSKDQKALPTWTPLALRVVMVVAALGLVAAFFLPWASADEEFRSAAAQAPEFMYYEPTGLTVSDAQDLSLLEYAQVYGSMEGAWVVYMVIMYATAAVSVLALILAACNKPIGAAVFGALTLAASRLLVWDFTDRGVLPNSTHDWGAAPTIYLVAAVVLVVAAIWLFIVKRRAKAANAVQVQGLGTN